MKSIQINQDSNIKEYLKIGFIQTVFDPEIAWDKTSHEVTMMPIVQNIVWEQIKEGFSDLNDSVDKPNIVVLPELTIPLARRDDLIELCKATNMAIIAGLDFQLVPPNSVENKALIIVPNNWNEIGKRSTAASVYYFGKMYFSNDEIEFFTDPMIEKQPFKHPNAYVVDAGPYGKFGVAICSDFFDIERFVIYKKNIHHLLVISYNKDTSSYYFLAEAISRLVYCNVIICNTGFYGDSLVFAPYKKEYKRIIYRHQGQKLFNTQIVKLPVKSLDAAQKGAELKIKEDKRLFKSPPPGYLD